nr:MAG TPA: hypothetical protein [Caudoviricetes sp.]
MLSIVCIPFTFLDRSSLFYQHGVWNAITFEEDLRN